MTLDGLRCFCAVVEARNFRRAAERVHRSQPAISQQLKSLETEFGFTLVDRASCAPTSAGKTLYARATAILSLTDDLMKELSDFDEALGSELRIGMSDTNALYFLPPFLKAFAEAAPDTRLEVTSRSSREIAAGVERGELDLGVVTFPVDSDALERQALFEQSLVLVVPKNHPLAKRKHVRLRTLSGEAMVLIDENTRTGAVLRAWFQTEDFTPRVALDSGSFEVIKRYVSESIGISFLPERSITQQDRNALVTIRLLGSPVLSFGAVWRKGTYQTKAARLFLDIIRKGT